jgi:phospholipid transport system substrate-binding protein
MRSIILLSTLFLFFSTNIAQASPEVGQYVNKLVDQVSTMLADESLSSETKVSKSRGLLSKNLDFDWMANYALGRNKQNLDSTQIQEFNKAYTQYVVKAYSNLVKNYNGEKTKINKVRELDTNEYMVNTTVAKPGGQTIKVDYLIHAKTSEFKVADIITEGVSLVNTQQSEFNSTIQNKGFDVLLKKLKG